MQTLDKKLFSKTMAGLCELYQQEASDFIINIYYEIFKDYDIKKFDNAVMDCIRVHKYNSLPKPAMILELLRANMFVFSDSRYLPDMTNHSFEEPTNEDQKKVRDMIHETAQAMNKPTKKVEDKGKI